MYCTVLRMFTTLSMRKWTVFLLCWEVYCSVLYCSENVCCLVCEEVDCVFAVLGGVL